MDISFLKSKDALIVFLVGGIVGISMSNFLLPLIILAAGGGVCFLLTYFSEMWKEKVVNSTTPHRHSASEDHEIKYQISLLKEELNNLRQSTIHSPLYISSRTINENFNYLKESINQVKETQEAQQYALNKKLAEVDHMMWRHKVEIAQALKNSFKK